MAELILVVEAQYDGNRIYRGPSKLVRCDVRKVQVYNDNVCDTHDANKQVA
jgi:hypothetical protein